MEIAKNVYMELDFTNIKKMVQDSYSFEIISELITKTADFLVEK